MFLEHAVLNTKISFGFNREKFTFISQSKMKIRFD